MNFTNINVHNVTAVEVVNAISGVRDDGSEYWSRDIVIKQDNAELTIRLFSESFVQVIGRQV